MKQVFKKKKILLSIIIMSIVIAIIGLIKYKFNSQLLFKYECYGALGEDLGYVIYNNGIIEKSDNSKSAKITKVELEQLKQLSGAVEDNDYKVTTSGIYGEGSSITQIYNFHKLQWITLSEAYSNTSRHNESEAIEKILELTDELYDKYLYDPITKYTDGRVYNTETCKYGYMDSNNILTIPIEYDKITELENTYYDDIKKENVNIDYSEYLEIYKRDTGRGIASKSGQILVDCQYNTIINYGENTFAVDTKDNKIGIIDINGNLLKGFIDGSIYSGNSILKSSFEEYTLFWLNGHAGAIDRELNIIIKPTYDVMRKINEHYIQVTMYINDNNRNCYHGVIDLNNNIIVPINIFEEYNSIKIMYDEGTLYYYSEGIKHTIFQE